MSKVKELSRDEIEELTTHELSTTTGSTGMDAVQAQRWLDQVVLDSEPLRKMADLSTEYDQMVNSGEDTIHIPRTTHSLEFGSDSHKTEGEGRDYVEMETMGAEKVEITDDSWYEGGMKISKQTIMTTPVDVMGTARHHLAQQIAQDVDVALIDEAVSAVDDIETSEPSSKEDYHKWTDAGESHNVTVDDRLTPDSIAEAMSRIEANNWEPFALVINSDMRKDLRTDSQFTNAAEYGSQDVILNGEVGMYLGVRIVVSNNIDNKAIMVGRNFDGEDVAQAVVWKEMPEVNHEFKLRDNNHYFYYDQAFETATIQHTALATIEIQ